MTPELIVVGTSLGGLSALTVILSQLPRALTVPMVVVQHRGTGLDGTLVNILSDRSTLPITEAEDKMPLAPGHVYLAPPDYHVLIEARALLALSTDPPVRFARPSIDVLFESAAAVYAAGVVGVILTGASADGADGLRAIEARGGLAVVEDPATAEAPAMPAAARAAAPAAVILPVRRIAEYLAAVAGGGRA